MIVSKAVSDWAARFLVICSLLVIPAHAQTGGAYPTWSELREVEGFTPEPMAAKVGSVDLRRLFPPVGKQEINDCTAWAVAAVKSYLEAIDQDWNPNDRDKQFSPTFIYNQVNKGRDQGSSPLAASQLLIDRGGATKSTAPYTPRDYRSPPSAAAVKQAAAYRNRGHALLGTAQEMREALMQDLPVVIGARVTPPFFGGRFPLYDRAIHEAGMAARRADQPHALHAMVVVGFSDTRQAFLVRNSWGQDWGQGGHCWVSYEVMDRVEGAAQSEAFLLLAMVMLDEELPYMRAQDWNEAEAALTFAHAGYDRDERHHRWRYSVRLQGPPGILRRVERVEWTLPNGAENASLTSTDQASGFRVWAVHGGELRTGTGVVHFRDGWRISVSVEPKFTLRAADRDVRAVAKHWPALQGPGEYRILLAGDESDLAEVLETKFFYRQADGTEVGYRDHDAVERFYANFPANRNDLRARVHFFDGSALELPVTSEALPIPPRGERIRWSVRDTGNPDLGYAVRLWLEMPSDAAKMTGVGWVFDGTQNHRRAAGSDRWEGFAVDTFATHDFDVTAEWRLPNRTNGIAMERIILPSSAANPRPYPLVLMGFSRYLGRTAADEPQWAVDLRLAGRVFDWIAIGVPPEVSWTDESGVVQRRELHDGLGEELLDWESYPDQPIITSQRELPVEVHFKDADGVSRTFTETVRVSAPAVDHIAPLVRDIAAESDDAQVVAWAVAWGGAPRTQQLRRVEAVHAGVVLTPQRTSLVGPVVHTVLGETAAAREDLDRLTGTGPNGSVMGLRLYYLDGDTQTIAVPLPGAAPKPRTAELGGVVLRGRFLSVEGRQPFEAEFAVEGTPDLLAAVKSVTVRRAGEPGDGQSFAPGKTLRLALAGPTDFTATLHYQDGTEEVVALRAACQVWRVPALTTVREGDHVVVAGPAALVRRVREARLWHNYMTPMMTTDEIDLPLNQAGPGAARFGHYSRNLEPLLVQLAGRLEDGTTFETGVYHEMPEYPASGTEVSDVYWGEHEGRPAWLVTVRWPHPPELVRAMSYHYVPDAETGDRPMRLANPSEPDYAARFLVHGPGQIEVSLDHRDDGEMERRVKVRPATPILTGLALHQEAGWTAPARAGQAPLREWRVRLAGPYVQLNEVAAVRYRFGTGNEVSAWESRERFTLEGDGFGAVYFAPTARLVQAEVRFADGCESQVLQLAAGDP